MASADSGALTPQHIALLWERMGMIYGHKWLSSYGEKDDGTWLKGLCDVTPEQIGVALERCRTSEQAWPPTLPEFRLMAKPNRPPHLRPQPKSLPPPPCDRDKAAEQINAMRSIVGRP